MSDSKAKYNPINERVKYNRRIYQKGIDRRDEKTIIQELKHIRVFENYIEFKSFACFNHHIANSYIDTLFKEGKSLSFVNDNLRCVREFLTWLSHQKGYKSKIDYNHIGYLQLSRNQQRQAKARGYQKTYSFKDIIATIRKMPSNSVMNKRNKAIVSLQALCGLRISELKSIKIGNLIYDDGAYFIDINPRDMQVKFAKQRQANMVNLPEDIKQNVIDWLHYLKKQKRLTGEPLFPKIDARFNQHNLLERNLTTEHIKSDNTIRDIFKKAFTNAELEYLNPHSFRKTLVKHISKHYSPAELNALKQSLGHSSIDTTLTSYGNISHIEQTSLFTNAKPIL